MPTVAGSFTGPSKSDADARRGRGPNDGGGHEWLNEHIRHTFLFSVALQAAIIPVSFAGSPQLITTLHYTSNDNFSSSSYAPGALGFNLADVSSEADLSLLPGNVRALVYLGLCGGSDQNFVSTVKPFIGNPQVFGFYLMDDPDPTGRYSTVCPVANLEAESEWIHANDPGSRTFIVLMNLSSSAHPDYMHTYNPADSHIDLYGLDIYPCRTELAGCNDRYITSAVQEAEASGVPEADIVPIFQAFGGGSYKDDGGGQYAMPTVRQEKAIVRTWSSVVPDPIFDYTYSWGTQQGDTSLETNTQLQGLFFSHNMGVGGGYDFVTRTA